MVVLGVEVVCQQEVGRLGGGAGRSGGDGDWWRWRSIDSGGGVGEAGDNRGGGGGEIGDFGGVVSTGRVVLVEDWEEVVVMGTCSGGGGGGDGDIGDKGGFFSFLFWHSDIWRRWRWRWRWRKMVEMGGGSVDGDSRRW